MLGFLWKLKEQSADPRSNMVKTADGQVHKTENPALKMDELQKSADKTVNTNVNTLVIQEQNPNCTTQC